MHVCVWTGSSTRWPRVAVAAAVGGQLWPLVLPCSTELLGVDSGGLFGLSGRRQISYRPQVTASSEPQSSVSVKWGSLWTLISPVAVRCEVSYGAWALISSQHFLVLPYLKPQTAASSGSPHVTIPTASVCWSPPSNTRSSISSVLAAGQEAGWHRPCVLGPSLLLL